MKLKVIQEIMKTARQSHVKAVAKSAKAAKTRERAQQTLDKARKKEEDANNSCELSVLTMKLLCRENNLDYTKTLADIDAIIKAESELPRH